MSEHHVRCQLCRDAGFAPRRPGQNGVTVELLRRALDAGTLSLCACTSGQAWLSRIYDSYGSLLDRNGREIGHPEFRQERGVPPGMLHGAESLAWMKRYAATSQAVCA